MAHTQLEVKSRSEVGHTASKLRRQAVLPAIIYGKTTKPVNIKLGYGEFIKIFKQAGKTHVIDVLVDGSKKAYPCIIHDMDIDPVSSKPRHVDFLCVNLKEKVKASVPIIFIGESPAVKEFGAVLSTPVDEIEVEALPDNIPGSIEINLSQVILLSDIIRVEDLPKSDKYEITEDPEVVLVNLISQTVEVEQIESAEIIESSETVTESPTK